jgi:putative transposase
MPRTARKAPGNIIYHVLNRGVGKRTLFRKDEDYAAFEGALAQALEMIPMRLLAYCLMPDHWHLVLWPTRDGQLGRFMQRLTVTHAKRWQSRHHEIGQGHLYQGRFKSFPVQEDEHFLEVVRYVERNPLRARKARRAENWRWSSLWRREKGAKEDCSVLSEWPVRRPRNYLQWVNEPQSDAELAALRQSVAKGKPFGNEQWQKRTAKRLGLESSFRAPGRPRTRPEPPAEGRREQK